MKETSALKSGSARRSQRRIVLFSLLALSIATGGAGCRDFSSSSPESTGGLGGKTGSAVDGGTSGTSVADTGGDGGSNPGGADGIGGTDVAAESGRDAGGVGNVAPGGSAGSEGGPDDTPSPVLPSSLEGLSLWLESSEKQLEASQSRIWAWHDSSANDNDATMPDTDMRPLLVPGALNGWPIVKFDRTPSSLTIPDRTTLQFGAEPFTVALVAEFRNSEVPQFTHDGNVTNFSYIGYGTFLTKVAAPAPYAGIAIFANYPSAYNEAPTQRRLAAQLEFGTAVLVSASTNLNDGRFRLLVIQRTAPGRLEQRIDGTPQGYLEIPPEIDVSAPGSPLRLGGERTVPLRGSIAELVMLRGPLSTSELLGLERYLMEKFDLPGASP